MEYCLYLCCYIHCVPCVMSVLMHGIQYVVCVVCVCCMCVVRVCCMCVLRVCVLCVVRVCVVRVCVCTCVEQSLAYLHVVPDGNSK